MEPPSLHAQFSDIPSFFRSLQAIKMGDKPICGVTCEPTGLTVRLENTSKSLQSAVFLGSGLFSRWDCPRKVTFGLPFTRLLDTLSVFASGTSYGELNLRYPGPDAELLLEADESLDPTDDDSNYNIVNGSAPLEPGSASMAVYAHIATMESPDHRDLTDYWQDPSSYFIAPGSLLKEAVEDLDWVKGEVSIEMMRDPRRLRFLSAKGAQSLDIELPQDALSAFYVSEPRVKWTFNQKILKPAFVNLPKEKDGCGGGGGESVVTKASLSANGYMKVTHMLSLNFGANDQHQQQQVRHPLASGLHSQQPGFGGGAAAGAQRLGVVQFVISPSVFNEEEEEEDDDDDGDDDNGPPLLINHGSQEF